MTMPTNNQSRMMNLLDRGFRKDSILLKELDAELVQNLQKARTLAAPECAAPGWADIWKARWDKVDETMERIRALTNEMNRSIECGDTQCLSLALESWDNLRIEDVKLAGALGTLQDQAVSVNAAQRQDWSNVAHTLQSHLAAIHACTQALRFKLELLNKDTSGEAGIPTQGIEENPQPLSEDAGDDATPHEQKVDNAAIEIGREQHLVLGFMDVVKAMFLWVESPEERILKEKASSQNPVVK